MKRWKKKKKKKKNTPYSSISTKLNTTLPPALPPSLPPSLRTLAPDVPPRQWPRGPRLLFGREGVPVEPRGALDELGQPEGGREGGREAGREGEEDEDDIGVQEMDRQPPAVFGTSIFPPSLPPYLEGEGRHDFSGLYQLGRSHRVEELLGREGGRKEGKTG